MAKTRDREWQKTCAHYQPLSLWKSTAWLIFSPAQHSFLFPSLPQQRNFPGHVLLLCVSVKKRLGIMFGYFEFVRSYKTPFTQRTYNQHKNSTNVTFSTPKYKYLLLKYSYQNSREFCKSLGLISKILLKVTNIYNLKYSWSQSKLV